ncbi:MAG: stage III sporulation AC/AD family protein [Ruminococcus sp.]|nr:stage III sporulation AC/AD family protein [Ruminococcus sp.]MCD7727669.1 stage III sporulation AC/AD family protein [Ruminococcus sp.]MCD7773860.1 stage III sporulation AC/AD family protein [Ruminococcus sp.]
MDIILICALSIVACAVCKLLEKEAHEFSFIITASVAVLIMIILVSNVSDITKTVESLLNKISIDKEFSEILFKSIGVCFITSLSSDLCKDCGESAMASNVKMFGRITVLLLAMPLYSSVISLIDEMLG